MSGQNIDILYDIDTKGKYSERSAWTINRNAAKKKNYLNSFFFFWDLRENGCSFPRLTGDCFQPFIPNLFYFYFFFLLKVKKKKKQFVKLLFWYRWLLDKLWKTFIINLAGCREYQIHGLNRCEITLLLNDKYIFQNPSNSCPGALIAQTYQV